MRGLAQFYVCSISWTFVRICRLASCEGIVKKKFFQNVLDKAVGLRYNGSDGLFSIQVYAKFYVRSLSCQMIAIWPLTSCGGIVEKNSR